MQIILINCRKFLLMSCITLFVTDVSMVYPRFMKKKFFPNQVAIVGEAIVTLPLYILMIHSFCRKTTRFIKVMMVLLAIRLQFGFFQLPGPEVGLNVQARGLNKAVAQALIIIQLLQLCS